MYTCTAYHFESRGASFGRTYFIYFKPAVTTTSAEEERARGEGFVLLERLQREAGRSEGGSSSQACVLLMAVLALATL